MIASIRACVSIVLLCAAGAAGAQTMYRCGSTFQDRPCDKGVSEQRIVPGGSTRADGSATSPSAATAASPFAVECRRRGEHAQRIMWQREGGATLERQINEARGDRAMIALIENVYGRRGSAPDVRAAIESECVAEKEKAAEAAATIRALQQQAGGAAPATATARPAAATADSSEATKPGSVQAVPAPSRPDPRCRSLAAQKDDIEARARTGGNAKVMESLQRQRRDVEKQMSDARC